jgi:hypothetical protein
MRQIEEKRQKKPDSFDFGFPPNLLLCIILLKASQELLPASAKCENVRSVERNTHSHVEGRSCNTVRRMSNQIQFASAES